MFKRFLKKISVLGPVLFAALSYPLVTHAFFGTAVAVLVVGAVLLALFQFIAGIIFNFAAQFTSIALDLNYSILQGTNTLIMTGWTIVRDITNLGFVLVIIVIAIATILRYKAYGAGQLLTKLIAAAIIVNFSLTIAGVFLDFSHSLTKFFFAPVQGFGGGTWGIGRTISAAFSPQRLFADPKIPEITEQGSVWEDVKQVGASQIMNLASQVFVIIFTFTAAFTFLALAALLFLRYLHLSFLLVLAPIVWLFWIIPSFKKYFSEWWSAFVKWTIFAPASAFFIYLSLVSIEKIAGQDAAVSTSVFFADGALAAIMKHGVQMLVLTGFFFGSLIAAQKLGVAGASGIIGLAKKAQKGATKWAGQKMKKSAAGLKDRALTARTDASGKTGLERAASKKVKLFGKEFKTTWGGIPVAGRILTGISGVSTSAKVRQKASVEEARKKIERRTGEDSVAILTRRRWDKATLSDEQAAAHGLNAAKKGKWEDLGPTGQKRAVDALRRTNMGDEVLAYRPDLAVNFKTRKTGESDEAFENRAVGEAVSKFVKDVNELDASVLKMENVAKHFRPAHYSQLGNNASKDKKEGVKTSLEILLGGNVGMSAPQFEGEVVRLLLNLNKSIKDIEDARAAGDTTLAKTHITTRDAIKRDISNLRTRLSTDNQKVFKNYVDLYDQTNWGDVLQNVTP